MRAGQRWDAVRPAPLVPDNAAEAGAEKEEKEGEGRGFYLGRCSGDSRGPVGPV